MCTHKSMLSFVSPQYTINKVRVHCSLSRPYYFRRNISLGESAGTRSYKNNREIISAYPMYGIIDIQCVQQEIHKSWLNIQTKKERSRGGKHISYINLFFLSYFLKSKPIHIFFSLTIGKKCFCAFNIL